MHATVVDECGRGVLCDVPTESRSSSLARAQNPHTSSARCGGGVVRRVCCLQLRCVVPRLAQRRACGGVGYTRHV